MERPASQLWLAVGIFATRSRDAVASGSWHHLLSHQVVVAETMLPGRSPWRWSRRRARNVDDPESLPRTDKPGPSCDGRVINGGTEGRLALPFCWLAPEPRQELEGRLQRVEAVLGPCQGQPHLRELVVSHPAPSPRTRRPLLSRPGGVRGRTPVTVSFRTSEHPGEVQPRDRKSGRHRPHGCRSMAASAWQSIGLCQIYGNEMWHYELATEPGGICPRPIADASAG